MDRALDLASLGQALGGYASLPSPADLQQALADAEVALFSQQPGISDELLQTAWFLHGVASSDPAQEVFAADQQRRAFQVSAHIFDLALAGEPPSRTQQLRMAFGAQVGYRRGGLDPNATAIYAVARTWIDRDRALLEHIDTVALEAGVAVLGFQSRDLFPVLRNWRDQFNGLRAELDVDALAPTVFGPAWQVVNGAWQLLRFLVFGTEAALQNARESFDLALVERQPLDDLDARWVAAHLRRLVDDVDEGSVWRVLPPDVPAAAKQALTLAPPPVLTLWRPQRELLAQSATLRDAKRLVLSVPTSAGKTLMAQLFVLAHLARGAGSVCYVTPMRSLARELRAAMAGRLRILEKELGRELPDWYLDVLTAQDLEDLEPDVDIMTPERLLNLVRHGADEVLAKYSLFVFDEAHLLGELGRGFVLEQLLAFLHWRTLNSDHRILLLSAALGNRGQIATWLTSDQGPAEVFESDWRGPRRLNALYGTNVDWETARREPVQSQQRPLRVYHPLIGAIRLRPAEGGQPVRLRLTETVGEIAFRERALGERVGGKEASHSTPFYTTVAKLAAIVGQAGAVLTVTSTRPDAARMAAAIAEHLDTDSRTGLLADFVLRRLGADHPLTGLIPKGVAFHHAALPADVLELIEDAFRDNLLRHVACTSTLTEGVNLPARTVLLAETRYEGQPEGVRLTGARLVNAIGRAGRAGKETEGWVILALNASESPNDFRLLRPSDEELHVESQLASARALDELADYEAKVAAGEDAVFLEAAATVDGFIAFVWFLLATEEARGRTPYEAEIQGALTSTLGFVQLDNPTRGRWQRVAELVRATYDSTEPARRRRYAESGASINSAQVIEAISEDLAEASVGRTDRDELQTALELLRHQNIVQRLFALSEAPREWRFRRSRGGPVHLIPVDPDDFLAAWLGGLTPSEMSDQFLAEVTARDFAVEQIVSATAEHFEHHLAWTLGAVLEQANRRLEANDVTPPICSSMPLFVRYGVSSTVAVELLTRGVRSRPLAVSIAGVAAARGIESREVISWLGDMSILDWRARFDATAGDIVDLLEVTRSGRTGVVRQLLADGRVTLDSPSTEQPRTVEIRPLPGEGSPAPLGIFDPGSANPIALVPSPAHADVQALLDTGVVTAIMIGPLGVEFLADLGD